MDDARPAAPAPVSELTAPAPMDDARPAAPAPVIEPRVGFDKDGNLCEVIRRMALCRQDQGLVPMVFC